MMVWTYRTVPGLSLTWGVITFPRSSTAFVILYTDKTEAIAIQIVSRAILFPAQALATELSWSRMTPRVIGNSNVPASKPKCSAVCGVRQVIVDEALRLEFVRFYVDSLVVEYGPRSRRKDQEKPSDFPSSITYQAFPSTEAPAGIQKSLYRSEFIAL
jgi:hypothetical protein